MASDAKASFSSKIEYRVVIRYLYLKGKTGQEIHCELTKLYSGLVNSNEVQRLKKTKPGLDAHQMSSMKKYVTKNEIWCTLIGEHGSVSTILHNRLGMCKLTARWVPKSLNDDRFLYSLHLGEHNTCTMRIQVLYEGE